ncbi:hypothetical protein ACWPKO_03265 [Coraliomargarita sp. W4R53]
MKYFSLLCLACLCLCLHAQALTQGMTIKAVEAEIGKPISQMEIGNRAILIYPDQRKLEFRSGKLVRENGLEIKTLVADLPPEDSIPAPAAELPVARHDVSLSKSIESEEFSAENLSQVYDMGAINQELGSAIENYEHTHNTSKTATENDHLRDVLIGFILEVVLTCIVLQVAFNLSGFPCLFHQIALLSLIVALVGATLEYLLSIGLFNPIRIGLSFIVLLLLIRQLTDVREWATAIRIAILARFISLALMWLSFAGIMVLFGL